LRSEDRRRQSHEWTNKKKKFPLKDNYRAPNNPREEEEVQSSEQKRNDLS